MAVGIVTSTIIETQRSRVKELDAPLAALLRDLRRRNLLDQTVVVCGGEFGRTPKINPLGGRDHWPNGFTFALAGGGIAGGRVIGETDPGRDQRPQESVHDRRHSRHRADRRRPRSTEGTYRAGDGPSRQVERGKGDPRPDRVSVALKINPL